MNDTSAARHVMALLRPLGNALVISVFVALVTFFLGHAVLSNPGRAILGTTATPQSVQELNHRLGVTDPLGEQFGRYLSDLAHGDLGTSWQHAGVGVSSLVLGGLGDSVLLAGLCVVVSAPVAIALGLAAAGSRRRLFDMTLRSVALIGLAAPSAFVGLVLILLVAYKAGLAPVGGWGSGLPGNLRYAWLPAATLSIYLTPIILRAVRERARAVLAEPHIEAAVARGVPQRRILLRHVLPNCAAPVLTIIGVNLGGLLSGAIVVEVVFGVPGLGQATRTAMSSVDLPVLQGIALVCGVLVTVSNSAAEIVQRVVDPRLRS